MALKTCPDCGNGVSDAATACPKCGRPMKSGSVIDSDFHGKGEGMFMKGLNCGCATLLYGTIALIVMAFLGYLMSGR